MYSSFNDFKTYAEKFKIVKNIDKIDTLVRITIIVIFYGNTKNTQFLSLHTQLGINYEAIILTLA